MAEFTAMRNNVLDRPIYGLPYVVVVPLLDADGDPISPSSPDSEISKNGDTAADCTNEATEISGLTGVCYLSLTGTELTCDVAAVEVNSTGAKTTVFVLYPLKLPTVHSGTAADDGSGTSSIVLDAGASAIDDFYNGMIIAAVIDGTTEVRMITDYNGSTKAATVTPDWNTAPDNNDTFTIYLPPGATQVQQANVTHAANTAWNSGAIGASTLASDTITNAKIAADAIGSTEIADGAITANKLGADCITNAKIADNAIAAENIAADAITAAKIATGAIDADAIADNAIDAGAIANNAITADKIANGAIDAATFAADVDAEILSYLVDDATRIDASALNTASGAIGSNGAGLTEAGGTGDQFTAIPWNAAWDAEVQSEVADALLAGGIATEDNVTNTFIAVLGIDGKVDTIDSIVDAILVDTGTTLDGKLDTIDSVVDAIKAKTDDLTFTVDGAVDANIQHVNDVEVAGTGAEGDRWGAAP